MKNTLILIATVALFVAIATPLKSQELLPSGGSDGNNWVPGSIQFITWPTIFFDSTKTVDISLWNAKTVSWTTIATDVPTYPGYYAWQIPSNQAPGTHYKLKIVYSNGYKPELKFISADFFSIPMKTTYHSSNPITRKPHTISKKNKLKIYPNPSSNSDVINIECNNKFYCIELYNLEGIRVYNNIFNYTNTYPLDITKLNLPTGTYNINIKLMGNIVRDKVIITR